MLHTHVNKKKTTLAFFLAPWLKNFEPHDGKMFKLLTGILIPIFVFSKQEVRLSAL